MFETSTLQPVGLLWLVNKRYPTYGTKLVTYYYKTLLDRSYMHLTVGLFPSWTIPWSQSHDSQDYKPLLKQHLVKQPGIKTWRHSQKNRSPENTARKKPSLTDLVGWKRTVSWRPPLSETGDRWRPSVNWLPSIPNLTLPPPKKSKQQLETQNRLEATSHQKLATDGASTKMAPTHSIWLTSNHHKLCQPT